MLSNWTSAGAGAVFREASGVREVQFLEDLLAVKTLAVLTRIDEVGNQRGTLPLGDEQRRHLHEVRPRTDNVGDLHEINANVRTCRLP